MINNNHQPNEKILAKVEKLENLVDYQDNSIVSRVIISKDTGTVTLFAFDSGQELSEHSAPFDALMYLLDGEAQITISGKVRHLIGGDMIIMPANQPHALKSLKKTKIILVMIKS